MTDLHPVDAAIAQWSELYAISLDSDGTWHARLCDADEGDLIALSWRELRDLMITDPVRKARP